MAIFSFTIGRFQPLHEGHIKLMRKVLDEGKNVCVALRDTAQDEKNPYNLQDRFAMFQKEFAQEMADGRFVVLPIPDVEEVFYGREVGWGVRQIELDKETEGISATKIRETKEPKARDLVDFIMRGKLRNGEKFIKLYAVVMLNYRQPLGDKAWDAIGNLIGRDMVDSFAFLAGMLSAGDVKSEKFEKFIEAEKQAMAEEE